MMDWMLETTFSNLVIAMPIALLALFLQSKKGMFATSHMLWALVLIKLITPPLFIIPAYTLPDLQPEMSFLFDDWNSISWVRAQRRTNHAMTISEYPGRIEKHRAHLLPLMK